jgi:hypothetical protein
MALTLDPLQGPGDWIPLAPTEIQMMMDAVLSAQNKKVDN